MSDKKESNTTLVCPKCGCESTQDEVEAFNSLPEEEKEDIRFDHSIYPPIMFLLILSWFIWCAYKYAENI